MKQSACDELQEMHLKIKFTFSWSFPAIFESLADRILASFSSVCLSGELVALTDGGESGQRRNADGSNSAAFGAISFLFLTIWGWLSFFVRS
jgi:hypothetical protein